MEVLFSLAVDLLDVSGININTFLIKGESTQKHESDKGSDRDY